jgi:LmbE family N-acetylglucosaminyl deacetylase
MIPFRVGQLKRVLCLGAHSDDIEIGCGGTLLKLAEEYAGLEVCWVVFTASETRAQEARQSAETLLGSGIAGKIMVGTFRESYFPAEWAAIKDWFGQIADFAPDLVFTHFRDDRHQDHRVVSDLTWNAFRNHAILEYEIPKYDGDLGRPNLYVPLSEEIARKKAAILMGHFQTQKSKHWFSEDLFLGLMRVRGMEAATRYAEAFHSRKIVLT